jgi:hypothetical protein
MEVNLLLLLVIFLVMLHKYFHYYYVVVVMMMKVKDCNQISMDNKHQHTLLVILLEDQVPKLDQRVDNGDYLKIVVVHVVKLEMRLVNRVVRMDIFLPLNDDDANDEGDSQLLAMLISLLSGDDDDCCSMSCGRCCY